MSRYSALRSELSSFPRRWLITGVAGFIGSHLLEELLRLNQIVVGIDNFSTGHRRNLDQVLSSLPDKDAARFQLFDGDICDLHLCRAAAEGVDFVLHQAALGSVPRSVEEPLVSHAANVDGFLNVLIAARDARVARFVYASSSSVYGDDASDSKLEERLGRPLSPYAATKLVDEIYAQVFGRVYGVPSIGLRYFNVFGPRQDPNGAYAAVIPRWTEQLIRGKPCILFGDAEKSRDFCYVANVAQANLLAALAPDRSIGKIYNVAYGRRTSLEQLFTMLRERVARRRPSAAQASLQREPPRLGDIAHSLADIAKATELLGYEPTHDIGQGLDETVDWYVRAARQRRSTDGMALVATL
jgi:UDP-N-acetylglucosamine 4-epimerase